MALSITNANSYVYSNDSLSSDRPITLTCWARMDATTSQGHLFTVTDTGAAHEAGIWSNFASGTTIWQADCTPSAPNPVWTPNVGIGNWHHLAYTMSSGGTISFYLDSTLVGTNTNTTSFGPIGVMLGYPNFGTTPINGAIAYARVWTAVLSQSEIQAELNSSVAVRTSGLWADWPLTVNLNDISGNNHSSFTLGSDAPQFVAHPDPAIRVFQKGFNYAVGSLTVNVPAGTAQGDLMVAFFHSFNSTSISGAPSGWNLGTGSPANTGALNGYWYWRLAGASEPSSYSWTSSTPANFDSSIITVTGVNQANPINVGNIQANASSTNYTTPTITPTVDNCAILASFGTNGTAVTDPYTMQNFLNVDGGDFDNAWETLRIPNGTGVSRTATGSSSVSICALVAVAPQPPPPALVAHLSQASTNNNGFTSSSINTTGADLLVVMSVDSNGAAVITDSKSNVWTKLTTRGGGSNGAVTPWYAVNPIVGTGHTFTTTGASMGEAIAVYAFSGCAMANPLEAENGGSIGSSQTVQPGSTGITPAPPYSVVITGASCSDGGGSLSVLGGDMTTADAITNVGGQHWGMAAGYVIQNNPLRITPTFTANASQTQLAATIVAFRTFDAYSAPDFAQPAIYVKDTFARANANNLGPEWTSLGGKALGDTVEVTGAIWPGDTTHYVLLSSGRAAPQSLSNDAPVIFTAVQFPPDQWVRAQVYQSGGHNGAGPGLLLRASQSADSTGAAWNAQNGYWLVIWGGAAATAEIWSLEGGWTMLATTSATFPHTDGDTYEFRAQGSLLTAFHNGVFLVGTRNTEYVDGQPGLFYSSTASSGSWANFEAGGISTGNAPAYPLSQQFGNGGDAGSTASQFRVGRERRTPSGVMAMSIQRKDLTVIATYAKPSWWRFKGTPGIPWTQDDSVTTTNLYTRIFEQPASDLNYIQSPPNPSASTYIARLGTVQQPISGTITLHTRASRDNTNVPIIYTVQLQQGSSIIQNFYHQLSTSWTQYDDVVSNTITNWTTPFDVAMTMNAPFVYDTFTGADNTFLTAHTPDIGSGWTNPANADAYITSNSLDHDTNNTTQNVNTTTAPSLSYTVSAQINFNGFGGDQITLLSRIQGTPITDAFYVTIADFGGGTLDLGDVEGGGFNSLASMTLPGYPYTGVITLSLTVDFAAVSCAINGVTMLSTTSSRNVNPGMTGLMHWYGTHGLWLVDNFMAVAKSP